MPSAGFCCLNLEVLKPFQPAEEQSALGPYAWVDHCELVFFLTWNSTIIFFYVNVYIYLHKTYLYI